MEELKPNWKFGIKRSLLIGYDVIMSVVGGVVLTKHLPKKTFILQAWSFSLFKHNHKKMYDQKMYHYDTAGGKRRILLKNCLKIAKRTNQYIKLIHLVGKCSLPFWNWHERTFILRCQPFPSYNGIKSSLYFSLCYDVET